MRVVLALAIAGCWHASPPPPVAPAPPVAHAGYCPYNPDAGPWLDELFPACPPPQFGYAIAFCGPGGCDRPCRAITSTIGLSRTGDSVSRFAYDAAGHWIATTRDRDLRAICTFERGHRATCDYFGSPMSVTRDATERITAINDDGEIRAVRYDAGGRVVAIGPRTFAYDAGGTLIRDGQFALAYDARGRVVRAARDASETEPPTEDDASDGGPTTDSFAYDDRHLVRIARPRMGTTTMLTYDREGRIAKVAAESPDATVQVVYQYACR